MKALLAGYGGIGANVYYPELQKLGYDIDVFDTKIPDVTYNRLEQIEKSYDLAVICTPNFTHKRIASHLAMQGTRRVFVEKPGVADASGWYGLCSSNPKTQFHLVKNNLYRESYGDIFRLIFEKDLIGVDINWLNKNRIPNPGSWFTEKKLSFGGVSMDLMPHLYCFGYKIFGKELIDVVCYQKKYQRWNLSQIETTDYGRVNPNGIYDVDDFAFVNGELNNISIRMTASWKDGYDKQSITLFFKDGSTYEWEFGLCPSEAYGLMLQDTSDSHDLDLAIHRFLGQF